MYIQFTGGYVRLACVFLYGVDNFDEPSARFTGRIIDKTTGENILADQAECRVRIYEKSYSLNPTPQDIPVKQDGTFNNSKAVQRHV
mgnify:CR=1 FL=1